MARGVLEFDLSDPDEAQKFRRAVAADDLFSAAWNFDETLRRLAKHADKAPTLDEVRQIFHEALDGEGVRLDQLWT